MEKIKRNTSEAEQKIFNIGDQRDENSGIVKIADVLATATEKIDALFQQGSDVTSIGTGFRS